MCFITFIINARFCAQFLREKTILCLTLVIQNKQRPNNTNTCTHIYPRQYIRQMKLKMIIFFSKGTKRQETRDDSDDSEMFENDTTTDNDQTQQTEGRDKDIPQPRKEGETIEQVPQTS